MREAFDDSGITDIENLEMLLAIPEYKVPLPPSALSPSQNDLFVLASNGESLTVIMVEGKVSESLDKTIDEWYKDPSDGRRERFEYLKSVLGLEDVPGHIRYQLLHRTASALITASRFCADNAIMLVHSFSGANEHLGDYQEFVGSYGTTGEVGEVVLLEDFGGVKLYSGWVRG